MSRPVQRAKLSPKTEIKCTNFVKYLATVDFKILHLLIRIINYRYRIKILNIATAGGVDSVRLPSNNNGQLQGDLIV